MRRIFLEPLQELVEYDELRTDMKKGRGPLQAGGCLESQKAHLLGALFEEAGCGCHLVVTYNERRSLPRTWRFLRTACVFIRRRICCFTRRTCREA